MFLSVGVSLRTSDAGGGGLKAGLGKTEGGVQGRMAGKEGLADSGPAWRTALSRASGSTGAYRVRRGLGGRWESREDKKKI